MDRTKLPLHKREELKRKEEEERAKEVYQEFVATFSSDASTKVGKAFVRGEIVNSEHGKMKSISVAPKLYKPQPTLFKPPVVSAVEAARRQAEEKARKIMDEAMKNRPQKLGKKKEDKRTSNLEAFKEELKRAQEERAERRKLRQQLKDHFGTDKEPLLDRIAPSLDNPYLGTFDSDPNTTNIFMSNLSPKLTEDELCKIFGHFGPLASVKVMWPRTEDERARGYNTGFIAFMTRKDSERAVFKLKGNAILGHEIKLSWGKCVPMPPNPIYIPPRMLERALPPPPSGLPFNAQPRLEDRQQYRWPLPTQGAPPPIADGEQREAWERMIRNAVVKVVIPTERQLLCAVHRVVEFVVREGPIFEAVLMNKELNNTLYRFLFDNQSPAHVYYRWKLFSILQGDSPTHWRTEMFRLFEDGSFWQPPPINFYHQGLPKDLYSDEEDEEEVWVEKGKEDNDHSSDSDRYDRRRSPSPESPPTVLVRKGQLSDRQRNLVKDMLDDLMPERDKICEAMVYCLDHAEAAEEIVDMICDSLLDPDSPLAKKIAKLYLLSDILNNCTVKVANVSYYRKHIAPRLTDVFKHLNTIYEKIDARLKAEQIKQRVMACFRSWEETVIYPNDFLINLQNTFLGLTVSVEQEKSSAVDSDNELESGLKKSIVAPKNSLQPMANKNPAMKRLVDYDLDGVPLDDEGNASAGEDQSTSKSSHKHHSSHKSMFIKSKWEEVDPTQEATRSKWDLIDVEAKEEKIFSDHDDEDIDGVPLEDTGSAESPARGDKRSNDDDSNSYRSARVSGSSKSSSMSDEKRQKLREAELKVMKYQDELESGIRKRSSDLSVQAEVEKYREKLLQKVDREEEKRLEKESASKRDSKSHHKSRRSKKETSDNSIEKSLSASSKEQREEKRSREKRERSREGSYDKRRSDKDKSDKRSEAKKRSRSRTPKNSKSSSSSKSDVSKFQSESSPSRHKKKRH